VGGRRRRGEGRRVGEREGTRREREGQWGRGEREEGGRVGEWRGDEGGAGEKTKGKEGEIKDRGWVERDGVSERSGEKGERDLGLKRGWMRE